MDADTKRAREEKWAKLDENGMGGYDDDAGSHRSGFSHTGGPTLNRSIRDGEQ